MEEERSEVSRERWRKELRKSFCKKDMIDEEGNFVKEYFLESYGDADTSI